MVSQRSGREGYGTIQSKVPGAKIWEFHVRCGEGGMVLQGVTTLKRTCTCTGEWVKTSQSQPFGGVVHFLQRSSAVFRGPVGGSGES